MPLTLKSTKKLIPLISRNNANKGEPIDSPFLPIISGQLKHNKHLCLQYTF